MYKYLVLSGAGVYGISFIGALSYLEKIKKLNISKIEIMVGSSAGGIIVALLNIGYTLSEINNILTEINFKEFMVLNINNMDKYGFDNGEMMNKLFVSLFKQKVKNVKITFAELYAKTNINLIITGSCTNTLKTVYFSHKTYPKMHIITALRITSAFPIIYTPIMYNGYKYVDGGFYDFFPIQYLDSIIDDHKNILGITTRIKPDYKCNNDKFEDYIFSILTGHTEKFTALSCKNYEKKIIYVNMENMFSMNFNIDKKDKKRLYNNGVAGAVEFIKKSDNKI